VKKKNSIFGIQMHSGFTLRRRVENLLNELYNTLQGKKLEVKQSIIYFYLEERDLCFCFVALQFALMRFPSQLVRSIWRKTVLLAFPTSTTTSFTIIMNVITSENCQRW
jgi:hypothetical protein